MWILVSSILLCALTIWQINHIATTTSGSKSSGSGQQRGPPSPIQQPERRCSPVLRSFLKTPRPPSLLYSFPGSGNTWLRLLLDHSTGVFSGSVYDDKGLYVILPGERACDTSVSVTKAHPHLQSFGQFEARDLPRKCSNLFSLTTTITKIVFLYRNPYHAIFSELQRRRTRGKHNRLLTKDGVGGEPLVLFEDLAHKWVEQWGEVARFESNGTSVLKVKFEDLLGNDKERVLAGIVDFLSFPVDPGTILCAFVLADNPVAHRKSPAAGTLGRRTSHRTSRLSQNALTKEDAFTVTTVCFMWKIFSRVARDAGYTPFGNATCSET